MKPTASVIATRAAFLFIVLANDRFERQATFGAPGLRCSHGNAALSRSVPARVQAGCIHSSLVGCRVMRLVGNWWPWSDAVSNGSDTSFAIGGCFVA